MTQANWPASEFQAMARGRSSRGTSIGPNAVDAGCMKAREAPKITATPSNSGTEAKLKISAAARMAEGSSSPM